MYLEVKQCCFNTEYSSVIIFCCKLFSNMAIHIFLENFTYYCVLCLVSNLVIFHISVLKLSQQGGNCGHVRLLTAETSFTMQVDVYNDIWRDLKWVLIWWTEFQVGLSAWYSCCCRQDCSNNLSLDNWGWEPWRNFGFLNVLYETSVFAGWSSKFRQLQTFMLICKPRIQCSPKVWSLLCTLKMWVMVYLDLFLT